MEYVMDTGWLLLLCIHLGKRQATPRSIKNKHSSLNRIRRNRQYNRQRRDYQSKRRKRRQRNAAPTRREFTTDDPVLSLEVTVESDDEDEDRNADEGRP